MLPLFLAPLATAFFSAAATTTATTIATAEATRQITNNLIDYGRDKSGGGHDHRTNKGEDRTPAQKEGDQKRRT
jgi:hypothetical protein